MPLSSDKISNALFHSLIEGPLLIGDLPDVPAFPHQSLDLPGRDTLLNFDQKLGHIYEDALGCLLKATPRYELLNQNLQLEEAGGRTVGELDYLLEDDTSGQLIHLELAVKFYLAVETDEGLQLPGPDPRDNYFNKLERMRGHQLTLAKEYSDLLPAECKGRNVATRQLVYGCIFDHVDANQPANPEFLNADARRGKWLHLSDCAKYFGNDMRMEEIPKPLWPVSLEGLEGMELEVWSPEPVIDRCIMVRVNGEPEPFFITPDGYPNS